MTDQEADGKPIVVITTGTAIDKLYFGALRVTHPFRILALTDDDPERVAGAVGATLSTRIVITHGTDTIAETAERVEGLGVSKTIVLTGVPSPGQFGEGDVAFNLGMAFAMVQVAPAGVYIALNGRVFPGGADDRVPAIGYEAAVSACLWPPRAL